MDDRERNGTAVTRVRLTVQAIKRLLFLPGLLRDYRRDCNRLGRNQFFKRIKRLPRLDLGGFVFPQRALLIDFN